MANTIRNKIASMLSGRTVDTKTIVDLYRPLRKTGPTETEMFAHTDVYPVVINKLLKEGKIKKIRHGIYKFR